MGPEEVTAFLTDLAVQRNVSAVTQNQALSAILFLYRVVLEQPLPWLNELIRARRTMRIPVVLTPDEVRAMIGALGGALRDTSSRCCMDLVYA